MKNYLSIVGMLLTAAGGIITTVNNKKHQDAVIKEAVSKEVEKLLKK